MKMLEDLAEVVRYADDPSSRTDAALVSALRFIRTHAAEIERNARDAKLLKGLIDLCGYVQNGSDVTVKLFQDDATRTWFVCSGKRSWFADTPRKAIDAAMRGGEE